MTNVIGAIGCGDDDEDEAVAAFAGTDGETARVGAGAGAGVPSSVVLLHILNGTGCRGTAEREGADVSAGERGSGTLLRTPGDMAGDATLISIDKADATSWRMGLLSGVSLVVARARSSEALLLCFFLIGGGGVVVVSLAGIVALAAAEAEAAPSRPPHTRLWLGATFSCSPRSARLRLFEAVWVLERSEVDGIGGGRQLIVSSIRRGRERGEGRRATGDDSGWWARPRRRARAHEGERERARERGERG